MAHYRIYILARILWKSVLSCSSTSSSRNFLLQHHLHRHHRANLTQQKR
ncbi:uncharacterized protein RCC_01685 [Ramularia collo-cygni]|uniref:Uncharacterized protein n=1 Tax=Ramularia collo-cygni TaxID=112498 RepID=A0A2D3V2W5_9PEZI|nr:uncharacterized protein RCC_01685 [Ramularia collo-cygni]CZT15849.1 uncharacterized protein RCC_01685 [Ramularia collo-cygni]